MASFPVALSTLSCECTPETVNRSVLERHRSQLRHEMQIPARRFNGIADGLPLDNTDM
jgi:hypothetical protein